MGGLSRWQANKAGGVTGTSSNPGDSPSTLFFDNPKALGQSPASGELSDRVSVVVIFPAEQEEGSPEKESGQSNCNEGFVNNERVTCLIPSVSAFC